MSISPAFHVAEAKKALDLMEKQKTGVLTEEEEEEWQTLRATIPFPSHRMLKRIMAKATSDADRSILLTNATKYEEQQRAEEAEKDKEARSMSFEDLVRKKGLQVRDAIVTRALLRFSSQVAVALQTGNENLAAIVYENASKLPSESTVRFFQIQKFALGESLFPGSALTTCWDKSGTACVLKPISAREFGKIQELENTLLKNKLVDLPFVTPFKLIDSAALKSTVQGEVNHGKHYMIMPRFADCLDFVPPSVLAGEVVNRLWDQVSSGLAALHGLGFAHMDIKPANIGFDNGEFSIIDLNSAAPFGNWTNSTIAYIPTNKRIERDGIVKSHPETDWWMLAATMAERCCGDNSVAFSHRQLNSDQMLSLLDEHLQDLRDEISGSRVLLELRHRLETSRSVPPPPHQDELGDDKICSRTHKAAVVIDLTSPPRKPRLPRNAPPPNKKDEEFLQ